LTLEYVNIRRFSGHGAQAAVYEATRRSDSLHVVIKHMLLAGPVQRTWFNREVEAMQHFLNHPYCLHLIASSVVGNEGVIITPFMSNHDLSTALKREAAQDMDRSWPTAKSKIAFGSAAALKYIHSQGFVHRDIKSANVFLSNNFDPVIGDWGLARKLTSYSVGGHEACPTHDCGTAFYMAPELYSDDGNCGYEVDVFAWGVTIYEMFAGGQSLALLFTDGQVPRTPEQAMWTIQKGIRYKYLAVIPSAWWTLIQQCWSHSPRERPTMAAIVDSLTRNPSAYLFPGTNDQQLRQFARTLQ
jgi:serine/threonine protein kinase